MDLPYQELALSLIAVSIVLALLLFKFHGKASRLEKRYSKIIDIDEEVEKLKLEKEKFKEVDFLPKELPLFG